MVAFNSPQPDWNYPNKASSTPAFDVKKIVEGVKLLKRVVTPAEKVPENVVPNYDTVWQPIPGTSQELSLIHI